MNIAERKKEAKRIEAENEQLARRICKRSPNLSTRKDLTDYERHKKYKKLLIKTNPVVLGL